MSGSQGSFYSQGFNFESFLQKGVDPRTGQYTCTINVYELPSHARNLATFKLSLCFNPLSTQDVGLGIGWAFSLSSYDHRDRKTLSLSTGERYQATDTPDLFLIKDQKLLNFKATRVGSNYQIAHKSGQVEILSNANNTYNQTVPITIYGANGRAIDLVWIRHGDQPRLSKIQDNGEDLVAIEYSDAQVTITRAPNSSEASSAFTLVRKNSQLACIKISTDTNVTWPWQFKYDPVISNGYLGLSEVASPIGLIEQVVHQADGHRTPKGAPYATVPYVVSHSVLPGKQQPGIVTRYSYSARNFLGYDGGRDWSKTGDTLYLVPAEYEYSTTVQVDGGASTTYRYNKFHLTTQIVKQHNTKTVTQAITYHALPNTAFEQQPPQYQLPSSVSITYADTSSAASRTETTTTEFDAWGNPTLEVKPDGLQTSRTYYAPNGEAGSCPPDPHGFQRHLKAETVVPAPSSFSAPTRVEKFTYIALATAHGALVDNFTVVGERTTALYGDANNATLSTAQYTYVDQPESRDHGRLQQLRTWVAAEETAASQTWSYAYPQSQAVFQTTAATTSCDGIEVVEGSEYLLTTGLLIGQTDAAGVKDVFQYDSLGRCIQATTAVGTSQEATRYINFSVDEDGVGYQSSVTDVKGVQTRYLTDGMERVCQVQQQDDDGKWDASNSGISSSSYTGTFRPVKEYTYNAQGQKILVVDVDWLRTSSNDMDASPTEQRSSRQLEYDDWGQIYKSTDTETGVVRLSVTDQIALTRTVGIQGEGQTRTTLSLAGVPTRVELVLKNGTPYSQMQYRYDGLGRLVEEEDALEGTTKYESDAFDRVCKMTWPNGRVVEVQYASQSAAALPTSVRINGISIGGQTFDGLDRLVQNTVGGRAIGQAYQSSSVDPTQITTQKGDIFALNYEPGLPHRLAKSTGPDGTDEYSYDPSTGASLELKAPASIQARQYSPSGLLTTEQTRFQSDSDAALYVTNATYSMKGKLQAYMDVHGREHSHEYDAAGRLSNLTLGTLNLAYSYGPGNRVVGTTVTDSEHDTSVSTSITYDDFGREVERAVSQQGQLLYRLSQSYGLTGLVTSRRLESGEGKTLRDESFEYDVHSRLTKFTCTADEAQMPTDEKGHPIQQQQFHLDDLDNIRSVTTTFNDGSQDLATYVYENEDDVFQLTQITHTHPDFPSQTNLAYNANGCLTRDEEGKTLDYDSHSRLKSVSDGSGRVMSQYDYDAAGRLIRQSIPGQPDTRLFYRGDQLIGIVSGDSRTSFLADHLGYWGQVSQTDSSSNEAEAQLWVADGHGSILSRTGPDQKTLLQQSYTPYGHSPLLNTGTAIAFNGQYRDPVTGWYHLGNGYRTYNPVLRRFHVPDPGSPFSTGEINPYAYCAGDPINRVDPSGQFSFFGLQFDWGDFLKFVVGFIVSIAVGVLTAGAGTAIAVGVGIAADVATDVAISPLADLAAGRKPSWKSVAVGALNGLIDGALGELGGSLLSAGFKAAKNFKTIIGRAESLTVNDVVEHSFGKTLKEAVKEVFPAEVVSNVVEGLLEIDPFPETSGESHAGPSRSLSYGQKQRQIEASGIQVPSVILRQASVASDLIRPALPNRGFSGHPEHRRGSGPRRQGAVRSSVAQTLNRSLQFAFGPAGSSQGKRQTTGSGALEALEKKRRMYDTLRDTIRRQAGGGSITGGM